MEDILEKLYKSDLFEAEEKEENKPDILVAKVNKDIVEFKIVNCNDNIITSSIENRCVLSGINNKEFYDLSICNTYNYKLFKDIDLLFFFEVLKEDKEEKLKLKALYNTDESYFIPLPNVDMVTNEKDIFKYSHHIDYIATLKGLLYGFGSNREPNMFRNEFILDSNVDSELKCFRMLDY